MANRMKLYKALKTIKKECKKQCNCINCAMYNGDSCILRDSSPAGWSIKKTMIIKVCD